MEVHKGVLNAVGSLGSSALPTEAPSPAAHLSSFQQPFSPPAPEVPAGKGPGWSGSGCEILGLPSQTVSHSPVLWGGKESERGRKRLLKEVG